LCKIDISLEFLLDWFLKSLLPPIAKDVTSTSPTYVADAIQKAQHFDLIYAKSGYLYTLLPDAPRQRSLENPVPGTSHVIDGLIGNVASTPPSYTTPNTYVPPHQ